MTINTVNGNILDTYAEAIVNPVNCVGVMGAGLALQIKNKYPNAFVEYKEGCDSGFVKLGKVFTTNSGDALPPFIINFPTKHHWKEKSRYNSIELGLQNLAFEIEYLSLKSIAIPKLGCGLGGLDWEKVRPLIEYYLSDTKAVVYIYE